MARRPAKWLYDQITALRERLAKTRALNRAIIQHDIAAMRSEVDDAHAILELYAALSERTKDVSIHDLCRLLGDGWSYPQLRKRVQLLERWDLYIERRRQAGDSGRYGLAYALELIGVKPVKEEALAIAPPTNSHRRESVAAPEPSPPLVSARPRYWLTPPSRWENLRAEFPGLTDLYPHPFGRDAFALQRWPHPSYLNVPFGKKDDPFGRSLLDHAREAVRRHQAEGCTIVMAAPSYDFANLLFAAGAEVRPLGRERWLDVETGEPWPNPSPSSLYILRGTH